MIMEKTPISMQLLVTFVRITILSCLNQTTNCQYAACLSKRLEMKFKRLANRSLGICNFFKQTHLRIEIDPSHKFAQYKVSRQYLKKIIPNRIFGTNTLPQSPGESPCLRFESKVRYLMKIKNSFNKYLFFMKDKSFSKTRSGKLLGICAQLSIAVLVVID